MKKMLAGLLAMGIVTAVYANCTSQTIYTPDGRTSICTTCCVGGNNCTTTCY